VVARTLKKEILNSLIGLNTFIIIIEYWFAEKACRKNDERV